MFLFKKMRADDYRIQSTGNIINGKLYKWQIFLTELLNNFSSIRNCSEKP